MAFEINNTKHFFSKPTSKMLRNSNINRPKPRKTEMRRRHWIFDYIKNALHSPYTLTESTKHRSKKIIPKNPLPSVINQSNAANTNDAIEPIPNYSGLANITRNGHENK